jgi:hypothetical protein
MLRVRFAPSPLIDLPGLGDNLEARLALLRRRRRPFCGACFLKTS